ncbi:heavy metal translocating P-type ATPase [Flavisolibacter tropicus]|uniref:ATPase P n=1 Tax=Flavisolibacter tropicus TaxID=1492898 RepID=A0A172TVP0_9BACT|nr:cation-translocating P-type ATPase [Flavisolibacter tropicus]ANE51145.1 ATPase P [Flavisolibacter tropicus]
MEKVQWKVEGMTCANCALSINKYLEKQGAKEIKVNAIDGDVSFEINDNTPQQNIAKGVEDLGYKVIGEKIIQGKKSEPFLKTNLQRFLFCFPFTAVLMLHMIPSLKLHWLMNPWIQLTLCLPVFIVGMHHFGRSAVKSLRRGIPNMNVLISIGAASAFIYSLIGAVMNWGNEYLFFETAATIITLVFMGEHLEDSTVKSTQRALKGLIKSQKVMANMIAFDDQHQELIFPVENTQLRVGDLVLIKTGEQVPADCKILWGDVMVNEALITGESVPVSKGKKAILIGGSIIEQGTAKAQVTAVGADTVLSNIVNLVKKAQGEKPPVQQMADRISAIFVPTILIIATLTLIINWIVLGDFTPAMMRSIAVMVIACPCAMGLATPAAIAVGLGRAARNGVLFRHAKSLELFKNIQQAVFDKTGTLTTGQFQIADFRFQNIDESTFKSIVYSLEKYSNHPLAKSIANEWKDTGEIRWKNIEEIKGQGMQATDADGNQYLAGSYVLATDLTKEDNHNIYIVRNNELIGWIDLQDEIRPEAKQVIDHLKSKHIKTVMLSGDRYAKSHQIADQLGIDVVIAEQTPEQKLETVAQLTAAAPTVMIGDGINDAPALAKATIGISMSDASQMAMQSAGVVLMNHGLNKLPLALGLGRHTYLTIKQNLFWAFAYNIVAIPIAALGLLGEYGPTYGALIMGLSDVVLAINSVRLFVKKVD